jgi:hypothetical protein
MDHRGVLRSAAAIAIVLSQFATAAGASPRTEDAVGTVLNPDQINAAFDVDYLFGLTPITQTASITGNESVDERIRTVAEQRGYVKRPEAAGELVDVDGFRLQPNAAAAWSELKAAANAEGIELTLTSGFRTTATQASIFNRRLNGTSDTQLDTLLATTAPPGYSKHHTGFTIDLRSGPYALHAFAESTAYEWLSANNWANSKAHGWLPSYPDGVINVGPDPEPWEFVWVGTTNIICAAFTPSSAKPFCDDEHPANSALTWMQNHDQIFGCTAVRFCPQQPLSRGEAALMLWRLHGRQIPEINHPYRDVIAGTGVDLAVRWLYERTVLNGTSATTYHPDFNLSRGHFLVMLWRSAGRPVGTVPYPFNDPAQDRYVETAAAWAAELGLVDGVGYRNLAPRVAITRHDAALILYRYLMLIPTLS